MKGLFVLLALCLSCIASAQSNYSGGFLLQSFAPGSYYTIDGKKMDGMLKFRRSSFSVFGNSHCAVKFKAGAKSKAENLEIDDMSSFVIKKDSFALVYNIKINSIQGEYKKDFAKVIISGPMKLYLHLSSSSDGRVDYDNDRYVISKDNKVFFGLWNKISVREDVIDLFSETPDLQKKIRGKVFNNDIIGLVKTYNAIMATSSH
jgi:hypothetical protein